ncbi:MAG: hypothetical protein J5750_06555 [Clostridiales bacterium]|nr:hypothetical protein [Clostridiales bacterium]
MSEERATYGYCPNCGEAFDRPYLHCPFCNAPNPHFEEDLAKKKDATSDLLEKQMAANRAWADLNREEVTMQVDSQIEQNLEEMKNRLNPLKKKSGSSSTSNLTSGNTTTSGLSSGETRGSGLRSSKSTMPASAADPNSNGVEMPRGIAYGCGGALKWILILAGAAILGIGLWLLLR